jgi:hypothetical protein
LDRVIDEVEFFFLASVFWLTVRKQIHNKMHMVFILFLKGIFRLSMKAKYGMRKSAYYFGFSIPLLYFLLLTLLSFTLSFFFF